MRVFQPFRAHGTERIVMLTVAHLTVQKIYIHPSFNTRKIFRRVYLRPFLLLLGFVMDSGNHSFTVEVSSSFLPLLSFSEWMRCRSSLSSITPLGSPPGKGFEEGEVLAAVLLLLEFDASNAARSSAAREAASISAGSTSSPLRMRAAISGVTRTFRTFVWKPGAESRFGHPTVKWKLSDSPPFPIPYSLRRFARYHLRTK